MEVVEPVIDAEPVKVKKPVSEAKKTQKTAGRSRAPAPRIKN